MLLEPLLLEASVPSQFWYKQFLQSFTSLKEFSLQSFSINPHILKCMEFIQAIIIYIHLGVSILFIFLHLKEIKW